ncbi:MAG: CAP domain-containing protein [Actinomycetia bacterium]|nr:CAP domain-containing protein [Actinomycetes bacterium]
MRKLSKLLTLAVAVTVFLAAFASPAFAGAESQFVSKINAARSASGKAPLEVYWDLTDDARAQSAAMAAKGSIYHNPGLAGVTSGWQKLGENVGVGFDVNMLHKAFMDSAGHRANILGDFNYIGVGVKVDDAGLMWATMIFMKAPSGLNGGGETTTTTTPPTTTTNPPQPTTTTTTTTATPSGGEPVPVVSPVVPKPRRTDTASADAGGSSPGTSSAKPENFDVVVEFGRPRGPYAF